MSASTTPLTLEEFHRLYDGVKPNHEYWFGEARPKPTPTSLHGVVQFVLMLLLDRCGWKAASEVTLKLSPDAEPVPDVVASRSNIERPYPTRPFELCVEIRSPADRLQPIFEKSKYYLAWGIEKVWIIDPDARTAWVMTREHPEPVWIKPEESLIAEGGAVISLPELFAEVDERTAA